MRILQDPKLDFEDVLFVPKRSTAKSRQDVNLERSYKFLHGEYEYKGIPIIAANMDTVGTFEMASALGKHKLATALHKHYTYEELHQFYADYHISKTVFYSMGILDSDIEKLVDFGHPQLPPYICIDVANGYSQYFADRVSKIRSIAEDSVIMAGNVVTAEMTTELLLAGADIVKVGIGPGSVCTTRKMTGVGYPQLSAIIECADAAHGIKIPGRKGAVGLICADGGCKVPGDVAKAFGAGADFVMLGGMLAGHDECGGEISGGFVPYDGHNTYEHQRGTPRTMKFYGMSSEEAMNKYAGGVADYRASEGKVVEVPYRGPVEGTVREILGGLRSTCTYTGAMELKHLSKCTTFCLTGRQLNTVYGD